MCNTVLYFKMGSYFLCIIDENFQFYVHNTIFFYKLWVLVSNFAQHSDLGEYIYHVISGMNVLRTEFLFLQTHFLRNLPLLVYGKSNFLVVQI